MTTDPEARARAVVEQLRPMFELLIGPARTRQVADDLCADLDTFLHAPRTWLARIQDVVADGMKEADFQAIGPALMAQMQGLVQTQADMEARTAADDETRTAEGPGAAVVGFVTGAAQRVGAELVLAEVTPLAWPDDLANVHGTYPGPTVPVDEELFERRVGSTAAALQHWAERWYKPMLGALLRLTRAVRGDEVQDPSELGAIMGRCRNLWERDHLPMLSVLHDPVRIMRNSEAHRQTEIDPRAETITFTNLPPNRPPEVLGPLDQEAFGQAVQEFADLCLAIMAGFRVAERTINLAGQGAE